MSSRLQRLYVLDALRIVLAVVVAIGHAGVFPLFGSIEQSTGLLDVLARGFHTLVFGPPAVIAFFLISGLCIHYPFAVSQTPCPVFRFYARRYLRILTPVMCTVALFKFIFPSTVIIIGAGSILWASTLWSIVCEEIYYALYPILNRIFPRLGWPGILGVAFGLSIFVIWYSFPATDWQDIGIIATAAILFPIWLLGCLLAEQVASLKVTTFVGHIWLWRLGAWVTMWIALILHFHSSIHQTFSGVAVGVLYYFWLRAEIGYYKCRAPWRFLVWGGGWSYSLYLIHPIVIQLLAQYDPFIFKTRLTWIAGFILVLLCSYAFYLIIERPSHNLARKVRLTTRAAKNEEPLFESANRKPTQLMEEMN